jgi:short-subunit dehydrogenase
MVLMSSMAGWQGSAMVGIYAASKAFVTVLAESLWSELRPHGVDVHACVAGATLTPNFKSQTPKARQRQAFPMDPEAVVDAALSRLGKGPTIIAGRVNRAVYVLLGKLIPRAAAVRFFSRTTRGIYSERSPSS